MKTTVIDFKLTGRCNAKCGFCWDFSAGERERPLDEILPALNKLAGLGQTISLTGGEPLLHREFPKILEGLNGMGYRIYLSTNGYLLPRHIDPVSRYVSVIGLPVDAVNESTSAAMGRRPDMLRLTMSNISLIRSTETPMTVKVGTVVTRVNLEEIPALGEELFERTARAPDVWRLYQFTPYGAATSRTSTFSIVDEEFEILKERLSGRFGEKVSFLSSRDVQGSYMFVTPKLHLAVLSSDAYTPIADLNTVERAELERILRSHSRLLESPGNDRKHIDLEPIEVNMRRGRG